MIWTTTLWIRLIIRNAVNASEADSVLFTGNGCTGAIHNLIHNLSFSKNPPVRFYPLCVVNLTICLSFLFVMQVVFVSPFEHHSNLLPWREIGAEAGAYSCDEL